MSTWFSTFLIICLCILGICLLSALIKLIIGPGVPDRIMAVNMIGTMTNVVIIILMILLSEGWLVDVAILYAALSFLAVIVLTKIYANAAKKKLEEEER